MGDFHIASTKSPPVTSLRVRELTTTLAPRALFQMKRFNRKTALERTRRRWRRSESQAAVSSSTFYQRKVAPAVLWGKILSRPPTSWDPRRLCRRDGWCLIEVRWSSSSQTD
ncbi:hypothetical protein J6590_090118 [Homalodisca vitripennis]|nr:hypothetical protein J6590_090118 [Homalodisca vitripennis]